MKISNRYYFDFNATAPLSLSVRQWLQAGGWPYGNPSSVHTSGKWARREIEQTREKICHSLGLGEGHSLFFHSGASEGITTVFKGLANKAQERGEKVSFFYFSTDHACVHQLALWMQKQGHGVNCTEVDKGGDFDTEELLAKLKDSKAPTLVNYTWVNNETGVVWELERALEIKRQTNHFIHVDSVQAVGKIANWRELPPELDAYTFSAHKFGALKGVGFSFVGKDTSLAPLIPGRQEEGMRAGTQNLLGIISAGIALEEVHRNHHFEEQKKAKDFIEEELANCLGESGEVVARESQRNGNTIFFILYDTHTQISTLAFDLAGMDVGSGSACASGSTIPSQVLRAMGYSQELAKRGVRLSFSPYLQEQEARAYWGKIKAVVSRFL